MGGCCCKDDSLEDDVPRRHNDRRRPDNYRQRNRGTRAGGAAHRRSFRDGTSPLSTDGMCVCSICGMHIDPVFLDSHQEACRANHRRSGNSGTSSSAPTEPSKAAQLFADYVDDSDLEGRDEDEVCLVCLAHLRCFAFLPCGHIATCGNCAKQLSSCPLCRQPRQGLCHVSPDTLLQYQCKHCHQFIAPTLHDGHREVCALRMRMAQKELEEAQRQRTAGETETEADERKGEGGAAAASPPLEGSATPPAADAATPDASPASTASPATSPDLGPKKPRHFHSQCVECGTQQSQLVISLPCGHRVLCSSCAKARFTCPVCLHEIKQTVTTYE